MITTLSFQDDYMWYFTESPRISSPQNLEMSLADLGFPLTAGIKKGVKLLSADELARYGVEEVF